MQTLPATTHAVVIGASIAGLTAARVLSEHFTRVTVIERDLLPETVAFRRGVPQAHHAHVLLLKGLQVLEEFFPGLSAELIKAGAVNANMGSDLAFYLKGGWRAPAYSSSVTVLGCSRPLLEGTLYRRLATHPQIEFMQNQEVMGLCTDDNKQRVTGVQIRTRGERNAAPSVVNADLVVDASGRHSHAPEWLAALGLPVPHESTINAHAGYASRVYRRPRDFADSWRALYIMPEAPHQRRGAVALPMEGDRWHVTLVGMDGDYPPTDDQGFLAFARSLPSSRLVEALLQAEPLSEPLGYRNAENRLRHYDKLPRYLDGFLLSGDSVYALNPVYGQGMTVAAMSAQVLDRCLRQHAHKDGTQKNLSAFFQMELSKVIASPWQMATGQDRRWAGTEGEGELDNMTKLIQGYFDRVQETMVHDPQVAEAFFGVMQMVSSPGGLFHPRIMLRVLAASWQKRKQSTPPPISPAYEQI